MVRLYYFVATNKNAELYLLTEKHVRELMDHTQSWFLGRNLWMTLKLKSKDSQVKILTIRQEFGLPSPTGH